MRNPLFIELSEKLKKRISEESQTHNEDWGLPTLNELAREYSISLVTAKKAVDVLTSEGITYARPGVGIKVNNKNIKAMGENLHKISVAVIFLDLTESSIAVAEIISGVMKAQQKLGLNIKFIPIPSAKSAKEQEHAIENIFDDGVDGILVASRMPLCVISKLKEKNIKFVWLNNTIPHEEIYSVMFDKNDIYLKIIDRLKELKFKRPAFIAPALSMEDRKMFLSLCKSAGLGEVKAFTHDILKNDQEMQNIASIDTQQLLSSNYKPDIIICGGEIATTGAVQVLMANDLKIPKDIHIISIVEKENFSLQFPFPIDTIVHSFAEVAIEGLSMLNNILTGKNSACIKHISSTIQKAEAKSRKD